MIAGANKNDYHLRNVTPGRDFKPDFADIRQAGAGDACTVCGAELKLNKTIEIGHIFKLGYKYSDTMGLRVQAANGAEVTPIMGSYGIGIERILACAVEQNHDDAGMFLPASIAPFAVILTPVNNADASLREAARDIYDQCIAGGIDALYDDRDERPGVKFKDADLIGAPYRITIGKKLAQGQVELVTRKGRGSCDVPVADVVAELRKALDGELAEAVWSGK
jgi:prolyl-tRNA synthetase